MELTTRGLGIGAMLLIPLLSTACQPGDTEAQYHPPLLPIELSVAADGSVKLAASAEIATPVGTFSLQQSMAHRQISKRYTLLVIRHLAHGGLVDTLIKIKSTIKMKFLLNGSYDFNGSGNVAVLKLHHGVSGIRIQNDDGRHSGPRLSASRVSTLPTPTPQPTPTVSGHCPTTDPATRPTGDPVPEPTDCPATTTDTPTPSDSPTIDPATPTAAPTDPVTSAQQPGGIAGNGVVPRQS